MCAGVSIESSCKTNAAWYNLSYVAFKHHLIVQELCESRGGRPGLSVLTSPLVSVDVKIY